MAIRLRHAAEIKGVTHICTQVIPLVHVVRCRENRSAQPFVLHRVASLSHFMAPVNTCNAVQFTPCSGNIGTEANANSLFKIVNTLVVRA